MMDFNDFSFSYNGPCAVPFVSAPGFSGTADAGIDLLIPKARELTPESFVKWNYGGMNIFGYGFSFSLPYFERMTTDGVPDYECSDRFLHPSYGVLCPGKQGTSTRYYSCSHGSASRIEYKSDTDTFCETLRDGTVTLYAARILSQSPKGFLYCPVSSKGPRGTTIQYSYRHTGEIEKIEYEDLPGGGYAFAIDFLYETRQDEEKSFRGGFSWVRSLRCSLVTVSSIFSEKRKLREIAFTYDDTKGYSLLSSIMETAFNGSETETAPAIHISYEGREESSFSDITSSFAGMDMGAAVPVNLFHEGACGLLETYAFGAYYSAPVYSESSAPRFAPRVLLHRLPAGFLQNTPNAESRFYSGSFSDLDGQGETEWIAPDGDGYYEIRDGQFEPFTPFESICPFGSETEFADIYGDGKQSAFTVISAGEQARCRINRGRGRKGFDKSEIVSLPVGFPAGPSLKTEWVGFVRFFGDGLQHRMVLRNKSCTIFPNLGGGHFGEGISIRNAPDFGSGFDAERICFADTTGSGTDDIIYIEQTQIVIYRNIAGAFFQPPVTVLLPERFTPADRICLADFTGDLLPQLIFIKRASSKTRVYSLRFTHNFLINGMENGSGLKIQMEYTSSAEYLLADTACGRPWDSVPPYHIPVVSKLSSSDGVTGEKSISCYSYRDGRYIKNSRALYGFGEVKEKHTVAVPLPKNVPGDLQPPDRYITNRYYIGDSETPAADISALIGLPVESVYAGTDGIVLMRHMRKYRAQALKDAPEGFCFPALAEEVTEQSGDHPRISRTFFTYDGYGNMTESETHDLPSGEAEAAAGQCTEYISGKLYTYINIDTADTLLLGLPVREAYFTGTERGGTALVSSRDYYYADPVSDNVLPAGTCKIPALLHHTRDLVFSADDPAIAGLGEELLKKCGYCPENGSYYISNEVYSYDKDRFYMINSVTLGTGVTNFAYDIYAIFVTSLKQVSAEGISLAEIRTPDYTACAYASKTDVNGNTEYYLYDAFGDLRGLSYHAAMTGLPKPRSLGDVIAHPETYLTGNADAYYYHDRSAWAVSQTAPCRAAVIRKDTDDKEATPAPALCLNYTDSHGRGYGQAVWDTDNWIISDRKVYADDMIILEYPSYYGREPEDGPATYPIAYVYDILGRKVRIYTPYSEPDLVWRSMEMEYKPWSVRTTDNRLGPSAAVRFRQDLDPRGLSLTDVLEDTDGDVLRSVMTRDTCGNILSISDGRLAAAGRNNISYCYDRMGRAVKTDSADAGVSLKLYGPDGRLMYEDSKGTGKLYGYDALGRFISLSILSGDPKPGPAEQIVWGDTMPGAGEKNLIGRIYQHTDLSGTVTYERYDRFGNALEVKRSYPEGGTVQACYSYNLAGEMTAAATESFSLAYSYSPAGRLCTVSTSKGEILSSIRCTAEGTVCSQTGAGGLRMTQNYDPITRFLSAQSVECCETGICEAAYNFTAQGNLAAWNFKMPDTEPLSASYSYDPHSRIIKAGITQGAYKMNEDYVYDDSGNMISFTRMQDTAAVLVRNYQIAPDSNRVEAAVINGIRSDYSYNEFGRPKQLTGGQQLSYDEFGRLSSVSGKDGLEEYSYDAKGRRTVKCNAKEDRAVYFSGEPLAGDYTRLNNGREMLKLNFGGMLNMILLKTDANPEVFWQVTDQRGSVILTLDRAGAVVSGEHFSPYGEAAGGENSDGRFIALTPYRFAGKEYDRETGLYYFGARYYSAEDGRMITPDEAEYAFAGGLSGLNLYAYCLDNPETFEDSSGNWPDWIAIGKAISGVFTPSVIGYIKSVFGPVVTTVTGVVLGNLYNAVTPARATVVATLSGITGSLVSTCGDLKAALVTGIEAGIHTAVINYGKEAILKYKPELARDHPAAVAYAVTGISALGAVGVGMLPGGSAVPKAIASMGGAELGVVGALYAGETGIRMNPRTLGNNIGTVDYDTNKIDIPKYGVIDLSFYIDTQRRFQPQPGDGYRMCRIIEYNATEAYQWQFTEGMVKMMGLRYRESRTIKEGTAFLTVIVHGGVGGHVFIDGDAPTHKVGEGSLRRIAPNYHTLVSADRLAENILSRIGANSLWGEEPIIKLISCYGGAFRPFLTSTARVIADKTRMRVAAYSGAISINSTWNEPNGQIAKIFIPRSGRGNA